MSPYFSQRKGLRAEQFTRVYVPGRAYVLPLALYPTSNWSAMHLCQMVESPQLYPEKKPGKSLLMMYVSAILKNMPRCQHNEILKRIRKAATNSIMMTDWLNNMILYVRTLLVRRIIC